MIGWKTVKNAATASLTEKRSEFIANVAPVRTEEEAVAFVNGIRKRYADARHNVYAYVLRENNTVRFSDDGEPHGTAGLPVLDLLRKEGISDAAIVVTRYFGGILLGTGGLVRAYTQSAKLALDEAGIAEMLPLCAFSVRCGYSDHGKVEALLQSAELLSLGTEFGADVLLRYACKEEAFSSLCEALTEASNGRAVVRKEGELFGTL